MKLSIAGTLSAVVIFSFLDQLPGAGRIELTHDHRGHTAMYARGSGRECAHVKQRQRQQVAVAVVLVRRGVDGEHTPGRRIVGVDRAFRQARRAGTCT